MISIVSMIKARPEKYALKGGAVFNSSSARLEQNQAVLVEGRRITAVCSPEAVPAEFREIDLTGCTVLPGMIDVHVHSEDWHAPLYLAKGITTVRDVGCELESVLDRRRRWNVPGSPTPRLVCTGPVLDCPGNTWPVLTRVVHNPDEARLAVDDLVEQGVDQIKAYAFLDWHCFSAILDQAHKRGKFVVAHLGKHTNAHRAVEAGLDEIEHLSGVAEAMWWEKSQAEQGWNWMELWASIDIDRANRLIDFLQEHATWLAVTRLVWIRLASVWDSRLLSQPQMEYLPVPLREFWESRFPRKVENMKVPAGMPVPSRIDRSQQVAGMSIFTSELARRNARILVGTDAPFPYLMPGFSFHDEIQALLECGMSEPAVLQAATLSGAQALGIDTLVGSVEAGKMADLLIVRGDPTDDIQSLQKIEAVIRDGRWYDPAELLAQAAGYARIATPPAQRRFDNTY